MEASRDSMASIRDGSTSEEFAEVALPLLLRAAAAAALVPGRRRVTLVTPLLTAAPPASAAVVATLDDALTERVVAPTPGLLVVLVMGARGKVSPIEAAVVVVVVAVRRDGTNRPPSAALTDLVAGMVRPAAGVRGSLLGPAPPGIVAVVR